MATLERIPIEELVDLEALRAHGRQPTPARLRAALPRGWVLEDDLRHARRDARLALGGGWILLVGLVVFGSAAAGLFYMTFPRGWSGLVRGALLLAVLIALGGLVGPAVTRALGRRRGAQRRGPARGTQFGAGVGTGGVVGDGDGDGDGDGCELG